MKAFEWKRKAKVLNERCSKAFNNAHDSYDCDQSFDWVTAIKHKKVSGLEDESTKVKQFTEKGKILADEARWWEAINSFQSVLRLQANNYSVRDMMAQCYMQLYEVMPAVKEALLVTKTNPLWWPGHQTLGRAYLGTGEVEMALKSFSCAVHIHPQTKELWSEDLKWAHKLLKEHNALKETKQIEKLKEKKEESFMLVEIPKESVIQNDKDFDKLIGTDDDTTKEDSLVNKAPPETIEKTQTITCCSRKGFKRQIADDAKFKNSAVHQSREQKTKLDGMVCLRS